MLYKFPDPPIASTHFAAGKVLYSAPGRTTFPVRLAHELFLRALEHRRKAGFGRRQILHDPCCGSGASLAVLTFLHHEHLARIIASDVDAEAIALARKNLALLTIDGMERRMAELTDLAARFGKASHAEALDSARLLAGRIAERPPLEVDVRVADGLSGAVMPDVDIVFTDVPYGKEAHWNDDATGGAPIERLAANLLPCLSPSAVVILVSDKAQKGTFPGYARLEKLSVGKRRIVILRAP